MQVCFQFLWFFLHKADSWMRFCSPSCTFFLPHTHGPFYCPGLFSPWAINCALATDVEGHIALNQLLFLWGKANFKRKQAGGRWNPYNFWVYDSPLTFMEASHDRISCLNRLMGLKWFPERPPGYKGMVRQCVHRNLLNTARTIYKNQVLTVAHPCRSRSKTKRASSPDQNSRRVLRP